MSGEISSVVVAFQLGAGGWNTRQEVLSGVSRELWPPAAEGFESAMRSLSFQLERLRAASEVQAEATSENTAAIVQNTLSQGGRTQSSVASVGGTLARLFGSGLGLSPLIRGLVGLFQDDGAKPLPALVKYVSPPSVHVEGWIQRGLAEGARAERRSGPGWEWPQGFWSGAGTRPLPVEITVQVQAMDSRSFMDHSWEIARAVREAMLQSHALNDVVSEL